MKPPCLFFGTLLIAIVQGQDVIVATERKLLTVNEEGSENILYYENATTVSGYATVPLAADSKSFRVFYSLPQQTQDGHKFTAIMWANVRHGVSPKPQAVMLILANRTIGHIRGLAYDRRTGVLYWTDMIGHRIWQCTVPGGCRDASVLKKLPKHSEPAAIAVDPCRRFLFWTDNNHTAPSVNRMELRRKSYTQIVRTDLFMPNGIAIDSSGDGRLYWTDDSHGDEFKIESANLDGTERATEYRGHDQMPMDLAFSPPTDGGTRGALHWSDWTGDAVWTLNLDDKSKGPVRLAFAGDLEDRPMGVLSKESLQHGSQC